MYFDGTIAGWLAVATLAGMAVGIEREWSGHTVGPEARFAGVRTFLLLGLLGGLAGWFLGAGYGGVALLLLAGAAALIVAAYVLVARQGGEAIDGTTETAALL
ncbi:MAG TPA: MgtC/SapB family protein, partial [Gemmatimonadales bacterium]|nr:MgtC/SapB family protein [Gemmatimonadales bacterium]